MKYHKVMILLQEWLRLLKIDKKILWLFLIIFKESKIKRHLLNLKSLQNKSRVQKLNDLRLELNKQFDSVAKAEKARLIKEGKSLAEANKESVKIAKLSVQPIEEEIKKLQSSSGALKTIPYKVLDDYGYQDIEGFTRVY